MTARVDTRARLLTAGLVAVAAATLVGASAPADAASNTARTLDRQLDGIVGAKGGPPGLSVLITRRGTSEFRRRGYADVRTKRRPTATSPYRIASIAKAFSGALALALVTAGKLSLDDTIGRLLPGVLPLGDAVTLRQALGHTGGLPDYIRDPAFLKVLSGDPAAYLTPLQLLAYVRSTKLRFAPGTRYEYSDTDNIVVGLMAEAVTGKPYEQLLEQYVSRPIGLRGTSLPRTVAMPNGYLHGYDVVPGTAPKDVSRFINPALAWASGGIVSTPKDVGRFFRATLGGTFFGSAQRRAQHVFRAGSSSPPGPGTNAAGLGLFRYRASCGTFYGHTGSFPGYRLFAAANRTGTRSVVFTVNAQIVPGMGSRRVSRLIRAAQDTAICHALR